MYVKKKQPGVKRKYEEKYTLNIFTNIMMMFY